MKNSPFCGGVYEPESLRGLPMGKSKDGLVNCYKTLLGFNTEVIILLVKVQKNIIVNNYVVYN